VKRILIFHISEFGGHSKAAENIKEALKAKDHQLQVLNLDGLGYFYPLGGKIVNFVYAIVIKHLPQLWGKIYDRKKLVKSVTPLRRFVNERTFKRLSHLLKEFKPDCFVVTQAFPCGIVGDFKKKFGLKIPLIAVVTDYYPHRFWIHSHIDKYVVACSEARDALVQEGVEENKVNILGIPISIKFLHSCNREEVAREQGFLQGIPSVLIMGGGLGIGPIEKIARRLDSLNCEFQVIAVCGKNKKLHDWFANNKFRKTVFYFSYIDFVHKIMDFADIIITKAGGITVSEALSKGLAIVITNPIPGQEERNVKYLLNKEAVIRAQHVSEVESLVEMLLRNNKKIQFLRQRAKEISLVDSSLRIAELILKEIH
jgi:processive 1,2-diacylglycerol beta-glucosyltransferase